MTAYPRVPLGEVCAINPRAKVPMHADQDTLVSFVPMAAVDERFGNIAVREDRPLFEVSKGYSAFENGDILFAKITPCMENGKIALARNLTNGIGRGSTEFFVLRPTDRVLDEYVYHLVRQPCFREAAKMSFTGTAGQQRVRKAFMENALVPVPPLCEQHRISNILNRVARIEHLRIQTAACLRELMSALFIKMFGDPLKNPLGLTTRPLGRLGSLERGRSRHRPRNAPELYGGKYPFVQTGDIATSGGIIRSYSQTYSEVGLAQSRTWPAGTLCITIAANIGMTGILTFDACFPDSVVGFTPYNSVTVEFVQTSLDLMQRHIEEYAPQAAQRNINLKVLRELEVPVPPYSLQRQYSKIITAARIDTTLATRAAAKASHLRVSLVDLLMDLKSDPPKSSREYALDHFGRRRKDSS